MLPNAPAGNGNSSRYPSEIRGFAFTRRIHHDRQLADGENVLKFSDKTYIEWQRMSGVPACRTAHGSNTGLKHGDGKQDSRQVIAVEPSRTWCADVMIAFPARSAEPAIPKFTIFIAKPGI